MAWLDRLERRLRFLAIPNVTWVLVVGQVLVYVLSVGNPDLPVQLALVPEWAMGGEWWRVVTFVFVVGGGNPLFFLLGELFFWMMGTTLEHTWGTVRFNLFLLMGWVATVGASFLMPHSVVSPLFIGASMVLAFATLFPDYVIMLFFVLPLQMRWVGLLTAVGLALVAVDSGWAGRIIIAASLLNYLVFFAPLIVHRLRRGGKQVKTKVETRSGREPFHRCAVCGKTDVSDPGMDFRYCPECKGGLGYCPEHIHHHTHVRDAEVAVGSSG
jgi:hypothetical protein